MNEDIFLCVYGVVVGGGGVIKDRKKVIQRENGWKGRIDCQVMGSLE